MALTKKDKQFLIQSFNNLNLKIDLVEISLKASINALKIYMETYFSKIDNHESRIAYLEDMNRKKTS